MSSQCIKHTGIINDSLGVGEEKTVCGALSLGYVEDLHQELKERKSKVTFIR